MNNAVFGKTMENVCNNVNVRLVMHWDGRYNVTAMITKSNFHSRSVFSENLVAIEMRKHEMKINKPWDTWICVSSMYLKHVYMNFITNITAFMNNVKLCILDSLIYRVRRYMLL